MKGASAGAPFSEVREWTECACCRSGQWARDASGEHPLMPCPECGQPRRCTWSWGGAQCKRTATVDPTGSGQHACCGQHYVSHELGAEVEECQLARPWLVLFRAQAEELGNDALVEALDLAHAEVEMREHSASVKMETIWEER